MRGADFLSPPCSAFLVETSPHAWSRQPSIFQQDRRYRNISTCVEQTCPVSSPASPRRKHLHMRGADYISLAYDRIKKETSPHAWSRLWHINFHSVFIKKHLHMRGADCASLLKFQGIMETSPHAWSRRRQAVTECGPVGNISTCVEQTSSSRQALSTGKKHLHMRGADSKYPNSRARMRETSPHAWSRLRVLRVYHLYPGNISTCVEQTYLRCEANTLTQKHLHMRGADRRCRQGRRHPSETSPHAWSRLCGLNLLRLLIRNISTCVEQTTTKSF